MVALFFFYLSINQRMVRSCFLPLSWPLYFVFLQDRSTRHWPTSSLLSHSVYFSEVRTEWVIYLNLPYKRVGQITLGGKVKWHQEWGRANQRQVKLEGSIESRSTNIQHTIVILIIKRWEILNKTVYKSKFITSIV